jgi:hypothetical protein
MSNEDIDIYTNTDTNIDSNVDINIDLNEIQESEEELGDNIDDDNAYLLDIMNDTEQWLKDNM